jgi:glycosyltransferase involved in cell wall biosynthesis
VATSVIISGLLRDGLGLGESARGYADALAAAGYDVRQHALRLPGRAIVGDPGPAGLLPYPEVGDDADADVVVVCLNPPELDVLRGHRRTLPRGRVNVASWAWEVAPLPASWADETHRLDEVWVPSRYVADIVRPAVDLPVAATPPPIRLPAPPDAPGPPGEPTRFLTLGDAASGFERKHLVGAVEAFRRAFDPGTGPTLTVKVWNTEHDPDGLDHLCRAAASHPDITVVDRWMDRRELATLISTSLAFVSLHRAEGFGLPIFEALACGVPVVASAFSAPVEWLDDGNAYLVATEPAEVPDGAPPYPAGSSWGEPDLDAAAAQLRAVWDDREEARRRAARGQAMVRTALSPASVGARLRARLEPLTERNVGRPPRAAIRPAVQVATAAAEPWPSLEPFLRTLEPEIVAAGGELLVGVRDEATLPAAHRPPWVQAYPTGSTDPFVLRATALAAADADLVVVTEDHCRPASGWLAAYETAAARSDAPLLAGAVSNGSEATAADWANYLLGFAAWAPPLTAVPTDRCPTVANCAVPGDVLRDAAPTPIPPGWLERDLLAELWRVGGTTLVPGAAVAHTQPFPAWHHVRNHFDDCRCAGAHAAAGDPGYRPSFHPRALALVTRTFLRGVVEAVAPRPDLIEPHRRARGWLRALAAARATGLAVGARFGPGRSGDRLD